MYCDITEGHDFSGSRGAWSVSTQYYTNDCVTTNSGSKIWKAKQSVIGGSSPAENTYWTEQAPYSAATSYAANIYVFDGNESITAPRRVWKSKVGSNTNNILIEGSYWTLVADGSFAKPYKSITDASAAAGIGANEVRVKASPADEAIASTWSFVNDSVIVRGGLMSNAFTLSAGGIIGNDTVGWWVIDYIDDSDVIVITQAYKQVGGGDAIDQVIVKRGVTIPEAIMEGTWACADGTNYFLETVTGINYISQYLAGDVFGNSTIGWFTILSTSYLGGYTKLTITGDTGSDARAGQTIRKRGIYSGFSQTASVSGDKAQQFKISGGWTADNVQGDGVSSGQQTTLCNISSRPLAAAIALTPATGIGYINISKINFANWGCAIYCNTSIICHTVENCNFTGVNSAAIKYMCNSIIKNCNFYGNKSGVNAGGSYGTGHLVTCKNCVVISCNMLASDGYAMWDCSAVLKYCNINFASTSLFGLNNAPNKMYYCNIVGISKYVEWDVYGQTFGGGGNQESYVVSSFRDNNVLYQHKLYYPEGYIHSMNNNLLPPNTEGIAWRMEPNAYSLQPAAYSVQPYDFKHTLQLKVGEVCVAANKEVTATVWVNKSHATSIETRLICKGGQLQGITEDAVGSDQNSTGYQQLTATVTPTESGVIEFYVQTWHTTGTYTYYVDVDVFHVSQAS